MWGSDAQQLEFGSLYSVWRDDRCSREFIERVCRLSERGYAPALLALGQACFDGDGVPRDFERAFVLYSGAADLGYPSAQCAVGNFYLMATPEHEACPYDPVVAAQWHRRGAEQGNAGALANLALSYEEGRGVEVSPYQTFVNASLAVHCSPIRMRPAETCRDRARESLGAEALSAAERRVDELSESLPHPWSEHLTYWRALAEKVAFD